MVNLFTLEGIIKSFGKPKEIDLFPCSSIGRAIGC